MASALASTPGSDEAPTAPSNPLKRTRDDLDDPTPKRLRADAVPSARCSTASPGPKSSAILLVLDLDGVICDRAKKCSASGFLKENHDHDCNGFLARKRPHFEEFVQFLQANRQHFQVMVWSSAMRENVLNICNDFFDEGFLDDVWGREKCRKYWLSGEERKEALRTATNRQVAGVHYELTYKDLDDIWSSSTGQWGPHNTLLIDDCLTKASRHPLNAIQPYAYDGTLCSTQEEYDGDTELLRLIEYLEGCRGVEDIQAHIRAVKYFPTREPPCSPVSCSTEEPSACWNGAPAHHSKGKGKGESNRNGFHRQAHRYRPQVAHVQPS